MLPTYNRQPLLRQAIDSVVGQSFRDWELVVADDGSTDGTREYLTGLREPRIRLVFLDHGGNPARTRAAALREARGTWVAFLDSDDLWSPDKLALQLQQLAMRPACRWGYTGYRLTDIDGEPVVPRPPGPFHAPSGWILAELLTFAVSAPIPTLMVRRSLLEEVGGFDETLGSYEDYDLALRLAARSETWATLEALTLVRDHGGRMTRARPPAELYRDSERVFRRAATEATSEPIRALCVRQGTIQLACLAGALSRDGRYSAALAALARGFRDAPLAAHLWKAAGGCMLRALHLGPRWRAEDRRIAGSPASGAESISPNN